MNKQCIESDMVNTKRPLSLYIHIPFCIRKCNYCDFLSFGICEEKDSVISTTPSFGKYSDSIGPYVEALCNQIKEAGKKFENTHYLKTVFIGGGTPTVLSPDNLIRIDSAIFETFKSDCDADIEYTIEANPGTVSEDTARAIQKMHVNRVSIGLQSAVESELKSLGRIHGIDEFKQTYNLLRKSGIKNINIDVMADIPGQSLKSYEKTLEVVMECNPEHISAYSLIVEPGTPFYEMQQAGKLDIADEEVDRQMYSVTQKMLLQHGYKRYEISNYAKEGFECSHNLVYWSGGDYAGLGLGAASLIMGERYNNTSDISRYISMHGISEKEECIVLSTKEQIEEYMFLGLRKTKGVSLKEFKMKFGREISDVYENVITSLVNKKLLEYNETRDMLRLTDKGLDVSNSCMCEFLID